MPNKPGNFNFSNILFAGNPNNKITAKLSAIKSTPFLSKKTPTGIL